MIRLCKHFPRCWYWGSSSTK